MKKHLLCFIVIVITGLLSGQTKAQISPIIYIFDASGSMWGKIEDNSKFEVALGVLTESLGKLPSEQKVGLVVYGHRSKDDCKDVEFVVDAGNSSKADVILALGRIKPTGVTPLSHSAQVVIDELKKSGTKATIILVTDGMESCGGNICDVVASAKQNGVDFRLHIIGFGLKPEETEQLKCAADAGGGNYFDASDAEGLTAVLNDAASNSIDKEAGNFLLSASMNGRPIDAIVEAFVPGSSERIDMGRTYKSKASLYLPAGTYDIVVKPLENTDVSPIKLTGVQSFDDRVTEKTVSFDGGKLQVTTLNNGEGWDATVKILSNGKTVSATRTYGDPTSFDVDPGVYDIEITAMVLEGSANTTTIKGFEIKSDGQNTIEHNFSSGKAFVGANSASGLVDAVVKIVDPVTGKTIAQGRTYKSASSNPKEFLLCPGTYEVRVECLGDHKGKNESFSMEIQAKGNFERVLNF